MFFSLGLCILSLLHFLTVAASPAINECDCEGAVGDDPLYYCGDVRLGPASLPMGVRFSIIIDEHYERVGGLCPAAFLEKWWNKTSWFYTYPPAQGFQLSATYGNLTLEPGMRLDRFGSEDGRYLAPVGTPFAQRALPPLSLNDPRRGYPRSNYHVYQVEHRFTVLSGTIAAWYGQAGQGRQYLAMGSISSLVDEGFLDRIDNEDLQGLSTIDVQEVDA